MHGKYDSPPNAQCEHTCDSLLAMLTCGTALGPFRPLRPQDQRNLRAQGSTWTSYILVGLPELHKSANKNGGRHLKSAAQGVVCGARTMCPVRPRTTLKTHPHYGGNPMRRILATVVYRWHSRSFLCLCCAPQRGALAVGTRRGVPLGIQPCAPIQHALSRQVAVARLSNGVREVTRATLNM